MINANTKTVEEVLLEVEEGVHAEEISNEDKAILSNIDTLVNELRGRGVGGKDFRLYSADELSRIAGSLALLKESMVDVIARSGKNKRVQEALIKLRKSNLREPALNDLKASLGKNPTVDDIKAYTEKRMFKSKIKYAYLEEFSEKLIYKWRAINSLLEVIGDRIHILQSQEADTKLMDNSLER